MSVFEVRSVVFRYSGVNPIVSETIWERVESGWIDIIRYELQYTNHVLPWEACAEVRIQNNNDLRKKVVGKVFV